MLDILVLYSTMSLKDRQNILDSLYCFRNYLPEHRFYYLDVTRPAALSSFIRRAPFDGVILHFTLLSQRNNPPMWNKLYPGLQKGLQALKGYKTAIPQDETMYTGEIRRLVKECGVSHIFSIIGPAEYDVMYPPETTGGATCSTVHPGYVDEKSVAHMEVLRAQVPARDIDIGYRARKMPYWAGRFSQLKCQIVERVAEALPRYPTIKADIKNTGTQGENVLLGDDWLRFLLRSRTTLGTLGGSSLMDVDGSVRARTDVYMAQHPGASFETCETACFEGMDDNIHYYCLGPRHFEAAMAKTCQVLLEGDYFGVLLPDVHYIELKADYSNLDEVMEKIQDHVYCEKIAQHCFDDIVAKRGKENFNTFAWFAAHVVEKIAQNCPVGAKGLCAPARLRARLYCWRIHKGVMLRLRAYAWLVRSYGAMCAFLTRHPRIKSAVEKVFRREFVVRLK